jgi:hypothetical protein
MVEQDPKKGADKTGLAKTANDPRKAARRVRPDMNTPYRGFGLALIHIQRSRTRM